jgi:signal transduction histidine kinase
LPAGLIIAVALVLPAPAQAAAAAADPYRIYVFAAVALLVLQLVLIAGLMIERQRLLDRHRGERRALDDDRRAFEADRRAVEEDRRVRAREDDQRRDQLLATTAHALRDGLAPIPMGVEILRQGPLLDERLVWARELIARQVTRMSKLVETLLDPSRVAVGAVDLRLTAIDLGAVARDALQSSAPALAGRVVDSKLPPGPVWVRGDFLRLSRVVSSLLGNAARHTAPGGRITLSVETAEAQASLAVRDTGVGIAPDLLGRIFDLAGMGDQTRKRAPGGDPGFGLPLVKQLVTMHDGSVEARSAGKDRGAELLIRLPLATAPPPAPATTAAPPRPPAPSPADSRRVLVVDDDVDAAESLRRVLALRKHQVEVAHDGPQALEAASRLSPQVVLLEIDLPALNGLEVARRLRAAPDGDRVLLVATTALGRDEDRRTTREAGFDHHLVKPIDPGALDTLLKEPRPAPPPGPPARG